MDSRRVWDLRSTQSSSFRFIQGSLTYIHTRHPPDPKHLYDNLVFGNVPGTLLLGKNFYSNTSRIAAWLKPSPPPLQPSQLAIPPDLHLHLEPHDTSETSHYLRNLQNPKAGSQCVKGKMLKAQTVNVWEGSPPNEPKFGKGKSQSTKVSTLSKQILMMKNQPWYCTLFKWMLALSCGMCVVWPIVFCVEIFRCVMNCYELLPK